MVFEQSVLANLNRKYESIQRWENRKTICFNVAKSDLTL